MGFKWRKWNRAIHRDLGYFFFGMTIIYALSGIALNHIRDWNPNYIITTREFTVHVPADSSRFSQDFILGMLEQQGEGGRYKKHYFPSEDQLKVFIEGGNVTIDLATGDGLIEKIRRRPIFHQFNYLHYNPGKWWTTWSDIFAIALMVIAVSGLLILKGRTGITRRGGWLTLAGMLLPLLFLLLFY
jgi:hypothetical protein